MPRQKESSSTSVDTPPLDEQDEEALWDINFRRKIRSDQRKRISDVHSRFETSKTRPLKLY